MITSTECERRAACPNPSPLLQPVLGTDKRNPVFTVYRAEPSAGASLHVYYGAELLEVVPEDRRSPAFKLLVGRLYNAGVKAVTLQESLGVDRKRMQRWGRALQSEDPQQLIQALAGRAARKLTPKIRAFVTMRFPQIYSQSCAGYSQRVRAEIEAVFGLKLSGDCLRLSAGAGAPDRAPGRGPARVAAAAGSQPISRFAHPRARPARLGFLPSFGRVALQFLAAGFGEADGHVGLVAQAMAGHAAAGRGEY